MEPIRLLLADDHELVRSSIARRLDAEPGLDVVGEVECASQAVELSAQLHPDVLLMDIDMPGLACFDAAKQIKKQKSAGAVVFLSAFFHDSYIEQALGVKAEGYVTKSEPPEILIEAIHKAHQGEVFYSEQVFSRLVVGKGGVTLAKKPKSKSSLLSKRELEVLRYIAQGMSKKEIGDLVGISVKTVESHSLNIMRKLEIHDRVELTRFAIREGICEA